MIDSSNRALSERIWNALAAPLAAIGMSPNQVTLAGLLLVLANCALYAFWHRDPFWFGLGLAFSFALALPASAHGRIGALPDARGQCAARRQGGPPKTRHHGVAP